MRVRLIGKTYYEFDDGSTADADLLCDEAAAICTDYDDKAYAALKGALSCGHESVIEHACYTFRVEGVSRVLLAQLTRHRLASFSVRSQRYCGADGDEIIMPDSIKNNEDMRVIFGLVADECAKAYQYFTEHGVKSEDARYILPQGISTELIMTMNARELRHFLSLRMCRRAQSEIRQLADEMYKILYCESPILFEEAGPGCFRGACPEGKRSCRHPRRPEELHEEI